MTGAAYAWVVAPLSAALIGFFLWRGRLAGRLLFDALAIGVTLGAAVATALAPFELKTNPLHFSPQTIAFLFAGLTEEGVRMAGAAAFLRPHWRARGRRDVVYAAGLLSLGFAALENAFYLANAGAAWATLAVERALTATPFHVFEGLACGYVVASVAPSLRGFALALAAWIGLAAIHGTYDFAVYASIAGAPPPDALRRFVAALGWDMATTLRALLAVAEAAAALVAVAAVAALPSAAPGSEGRIVRFARSRRLGRLIGLALTGAALLAVGGGAVAGLALESSAPFFAAALYAILPLGLGALFLVEPGPKPQPSARARRALRTSVVAAALALGVAAVVWGPGLWRSFETTRFEARGVRLAASGDYARAIDAYSQALEVSPERIDTRARRAAAYAAQGRFAPALADLDAALRLAPDNIALYAQRADADRQNNDYAAAQADLDAALKLKPDEPKLLALRAQARLEGGDAKGAYADLAAASRTAPDDGLVRRVFAGWDVDAGDFDAGLRDLNARLHADPTDAMAAFQRGRVWLYKSEPRKALEDFVRADDKPAVLYPALWRYLAEARLEIDGAAVLRKRLAQAPTKWPAPVARLYLGEIDLAAARGLAGNDGERCEADFYFAALRMQNDPAQETVARLRAAVAECPTGFIEYEGAKAQLRRFAR